MKVFPIIHLGASKASYLLLLPFCITVSYAQQVTNADDAGAGSLRDAISLASAGDTITFDAELDGSTLELVSPIVIDKAIIVDASNLLDGFTIDGNSNGDFITDAGETNCLVISDNNPSTTINVTISGITIKDGVYEGTTAGANIHNLENLTLTRCHISNGRAFDDNNSALGGGIYNQGGDLTLTECSIENNQVQADIITGNGVSSGGGIYNSGGNLTFSKCSISNNTADLGGGIYTTGNSNLALSFDHCTLAKNSAHGNGGAIFNSNSSLALTNCSLSTNYANSGGGIFQSSNGGADTVALTDSIIAGNSAKLQGPDIENTNSTFSANGFNIIGQLGNSGLIEGAAVTTTEDILLAPLGNYGGPTYSMHPLIDSPAILSDEVDITRTDQRGFTLTGPPTIGAIQVSTPTKVSDEAELRAALSASENTEGQIICFDSALDGDDITLSENSTHLEVPSNVDGLFIDASNLESGLTIDANTSETDRRRVLLINSDSTVAIQGLTISNGWTVDPDTFSGGVGGGILLSDNNSITLNHSSIIHNRAGLNSDGGGIGGFRSHICLNYSTVSNNSSGDEGIVEKPFINTAGEGGGIFCSLSTVIINHSTISHNSTGNGLTSTGGGGGGISIIRSLLFINSSTISNNYTGNGGVFRRGGFGAGIWGRSNEEITINDSTITNNRTGYAADSNGNLTNEQAVGGGVSAFNNSTVKNSIIAGNSGEGPDIDPDSTIEIGNNIFSGDPMLAPLGNYGGPTQSMHPLIDSPAILSDEVDITRTDQRGFTLTGPPTIGAIQVSTPTKVSDEAELRAALSASENTEGQIICFDSALDGDDITLSENSTHLEVPSNVDGLFIDASNLESGLTIDANTSETDRRRVLLINSDSTVAIQGLTISNGWTADIRAGFTNIGGGISVLDRCNTTLNHCNISNNQAGLSNVGGGLSQGRNSIMVLNYSYINHNAAGNQGGTSSQGVAGLTIPGFGGGVYSFMSKALIVNNSTISYNRAGRDGGRGGGIMTLITSVTINSSTISNNDADIGAGIRTLNPPAFIINNSTISGNFTGGVINSSDADEPGIGVSSDGSFILNNSIVAGNTEAIAFSSTEPTEIGSNILSGDPLLAPLGDYGGPTQTMPPLPGSPAINAAVESTRKTDQRGFTVSSFSDDIGAVELQLGENALELAWATDNDNDGAEFGLEFALGTDPSIANSQSDFLPFINFNDNGEPTVETNFNDNAIGAISWIIESSSDLQIWNEIYSSSNPLDNNATNLEVDTDQSVSNGVITLTDEREDTANAPNLFYRLGAELSE